MRANKFTIKKKSLGCSIIILLLICLYISGCAGAWKEKGQEAAKEKKAEVNQESENEALAEKEREAVQEKVESVKVVEPQKKPENAEAEPTKDAVEEPKNENWNVGEREEQMVAPSVSGTLAVNGTQLVDEDGYPIQLRGISTHGLSWFPEYVNKESFLQLHTEWNASVVRLAMYVAEEGGYCTGGDKEALKQLVKDGVAYAEAADMYVIVDWHVLREGNPNLYKEEAKAFFAEISKEFADKKHVLYEICNEPNGGVSWEEVKAYAEEVIPVIRENDKDAIIIVGTPTWSQDVDMAAASPITGYDNIMYSLHFYAATHTEQLRQKMTAAIEAGLPIFVTEFGTCDASGNGGIDYGQSEEWIARMNEYGVSYVAWNLSNKAETSAILKPECEKTAGFTGEDLTDNGKWIYEKLTGEHANAGKLLPKEESIPQAVEKEEKLENSDTAVGKDGAVSYTATVANTWQTDGKTFYQYNLTLQNSSTTEVDGWEITLEFSEAITLSDGWNGTYSVTGSEMSITAMDYNKKIPAEGEVTDIGFIISAGDGLSLKK